MRNQKLPADVVDQLNLILPLQLMAVQQHFIHVLTLKCWNATNLSQGIIAIDEVDLPNAMKVVNLLVSTGNVPGIGQNKQSLIDQMPLPGSTYQGSLFS